jgi:hypothetical protein
MTMAGQALAQAPGPGVLQPADVDFHCSAPGTHPGRPDLRTVGVRAPVGAAATTKRATPDDAAPSVLWPASSGVVFRDFVVAGTGRPWFSAAPPGRARAAD